MKPLFFCQTAFFKEAKIMEYNPEAVFEGTVEGLKRFIDIYVYEMQSVIYDNYTVKDSVSMYLGRGKARKSSLHVDLYSNIEKETAALVKKLEAEPDSGTAYDGVCTIINYGRKDFNSLEDTMRLAFISIEALAIPLLAFVEAEDAAKICAEYTSKYPVKQMLPKQKELYYKLKECTGEEVKKKKEVFDFFVSKNDNQIKRLTKPGKKKRRIF